MYGNGAEGTLLASLLADVVAQQGLAATLDADVYGFLLGQEGLYDKRYAWLDGRLNRQTGTLAKIVRALARRQQAQVDLPSQLYRLLALQTNPP
jgi:ferric-dicitrate binding protein FerR (iron transport regulator)